MSSSSAPSSSNPERDQHMLAVGRQCSHPSCLLVDFLPFKCQHCANSYCADHFKPASHSCAKYDESKYNRVAPDCPLCNEPVPIPPGEDPNIRMERHLARDCSVMTGRSQKASATPKCARPKCGKLLFAQIKCDKCYQKFCPEHRFPNSHNCPSISTAALPTPTGTAINPSSQARQMSASGLAAMKRVTASVKSPAPSPARANPPTVPTPTKGAVSSSVAVASGSNTSVSKPFSKTDRSPTITIPGTTHTPTDASEHTTADTTDHHSSKHSPKSPLDFHSRSRQEKDSQIRAMRARAQKGLLSEDEKVILASLEAERARGRGDKDCAVM